MHSKKYSTDKSIYRLMQSPKSAVAGLVKHSSALLKAQALVHDALEPGCRAHCWLVSYANGRLKLQSDTSAWAARIRLQQRSILSQLARLPEFTGLKHLSVTVRPISQKPDRKRRAKTISIQGKDSLRDTAKVTADESLRQALLKLADR